MQTDRLKKAVADRVERLEATGVSDFLTGIRRGIEKEGLRVTLTGQLSARNHPAGLGSALTNRYITTDYAESQLELISPALEKPEAAVDFLHNLHCFVYRNLADEVIWAGSMPCRIPDQSVIRLACYGDSNLGRLKHLYRVGLEHRYGRMMQAISGIHYNLSFPDDFWEAYRNLQQDRAALKEFRSSEYFRLIRNFRRHSWLLLYLFGSSPAFCRSFLQGKVHQLSQLHQYTLYLPHATSLRMSDLGYSTSAQASLDICFNQLSTYIASLDRAINTSYPAYREIGVKVDGSYRQLNDGILQVENEFYSDIRPKRLAKPGERPLQALLSRGVQYIEVRHTDINPFLPAGLDLEQTRFLDAFLLGCLLLPGEPVNATECDLIRENLARVTTRGREPGLEVVDVLGPQPLKQAGAGLLEAFRLSAELLDRVYGGSDYVTAVDRQQEKLADPGRTPSAMLLKQLQATGMEYGQWLLAQSRAHRQWFETMKPHQATVAELFRETKRSIAAQRDLETAENQDFDRFLSNYLARPLVS